MAYFFFYKKINNFLYRKNYQEKLNTWYAGGLNSRIESYPPYPLPACKGTEIGLPY